MHSLPLSLAVLLVVGSAMPLAAQGRTAKPQREADRAAVSAGVMFAPHDVELIRTHYRTQSQLPSSALEKKVTRGGTLPPGWEKKLERFPATLERDLIVLPPGHARGILDGQAVIYNPVTHAILDSTPLF